MNHEIRLRSLNPESSSDLTVAKYLDVISSGPDGADNPFENNKSTMSLPKLKKWMLGDNFHELKVVEVDGKPIESFIYSAFDIDKKSQQRSIKVAAEAQVPINHLRALNTWSSNLNKRQEVAALTMFLASNFMDNSQYAFVYYSDPTETRDNELLEKIGARALITNFNYENPGKKGTDIAYLITKDFFDTALLNLNLR
jgi:hypothetical protein